MDKILKFILITIFYSSSHFAIAENLQPMIEKYNSKTALFAGILGGLFILGRGNSWYYFIFLSTIPLIYLFLTF